MQLPKDSMCYFCWANNACDSNNDWNSAALSKLSVDYTALQALNNIMQKNSGYEIHTIAIGFHIVYT